uniref:LYR motif-containing protein 2 n=1 Tax=Calidris pygmaea TaxID=425635 RepID=A0A8C3JUQ3_9CHAR
MPVQLWCPWLRNLWPPTAPARAWHRAQLPGSSGPSAATFSRSPAMTSLPFLRRQQVLQLYRRILRAIREVPAEADRRYLRDWAREEFRRNKDATEEDAIRMMITQGNMQLQELQRALKLAKS